MALLVIVGALFALFFMAGRPPWVVRHLMLSPAEVARQPWQLATSGLLHAAPAAAFVDLISLWIFGSAVEQRAGRWRMIGLFAGAQLLGGLAAVLVGRQVAPGAVLAGCGAGVLGLIAAFGTLWGDEQLAVLGRLRMRARTLALVLLALALAPPMLRNDWLHLAMLSTGAAVGLALSANVAQRVSTGLQQRRIRRRYRVIQGGRHGPAAL